MYAPVVAPKTSFTISNLLPGLGESNVELPLPTTFVGTGNPPLQKEKRHVSYWKILKKTLHHSQICRICRIHTLRSMLYATLVSTWRQVQDWEVLLTFFSFLTLKPFCHPQRPRLLLYGSCSGHKRQGWVLSGRVPGGQMSIFGVVHADLFDAKLESLQIPLSLCAEVIGPTRTESEEPKEVEPMEATVIAYAAPYCTPTKTFPVSICESAAPKIIPCRCSWQICWREGAAVKLFLWYGMHVLLKYWSI